MKICAVSNFNNYYRAPVYRALAAHPGFDVDFLFYSGGTESYWLKEHGTVSEQRQIDLAGFTIAGTRVTPGLVPRLLAKPYDVYFKCINGRFALLATYLVAKLRRRPFVLWTEVSMRFRTPGHRLGQPLLNRIYRGADAIAACGSHVRDHLVSEGVDPGRIVIARHAVENAFYSRPVPEEERAALRRRLDIPAAAPVILYVGRFTEVKGLDYLIEAFARLVADGRDAGACLVMAGTGELRDRLQRQAAEAGIADRVRWPGYVARDAIVPFYAISEFLVLPSIELGHMRETWGLVVNEAFCQGVPAVTSDSVGAANGGLVRDGETGRVVAERDAGALAAAMGDLLGDPEARRRMSETCRTEIADWTSEKMGEAFATAIEIGVRRHGDRRGRASRSRHAEDTS